jgi:hypothetical protein
MMIYQPARVPYVCMSRNSEWAVTTVTGERVGEKEEEESVREKERGADESENGGERAKERARVRERKERGESDGVRRVWVKEKR